MLLEEILQRVQSLYSRGVQSKDTRLTPRHIYSATSTARSILLKQQYNKKQITGRWSYQTLPCVELIKAPVHECPCVPSAGCMILRTKYKIPKPISGIDRHLIQAVTSLDGSVKFEETNFEIAKFANKGNKYINDKPNYYPYNNYLYLTSIKALKAITVLGLFDDIIEAFQFPSLCTDGCIDCQCADIMDIEYPIDGDLVKPLIQIANDELIIIMKQMTEDKGNNASDDTGSGGMVHQANDQQQ